jgi:hypothetical protein
MTGLLGLIIWLVVLGVIVWLAFWVLQQFPAPEPVGRIIKVLIVVIAVVMLIAILMGTFGSIPLPGVVR